MDKNDLSDVVCCSQCPDGNCPDCPVAEAKKNNRWWKRLARKIGISAESTPDKPANRDETSNSK
jgi:hypothetical protein